MSPPRLDLSDKPRRFTLVRSLLLVCVALVTLWAFNRHFEHLADQFAEQEAISDTTGVLTPERLALLREAAHALRLGYGLDLRIQIRNGPLALPQPGPATLFIGLDTASRTSAVLLPALLAKALPPELARRLQSDYFAPYLDDGSWPEGLYAAVLAIMEALSDQR